MAGTKYEFVKVSPTYDWVSGDNYGLAREWDWCPITKEAGEKAERSEQVLMSCACNPKSAPFKYRFHSRHDFVSKYIHCSGEWAILIRQAGEVHVDIYTEDRDEDTVLIQAGLPAQGNNVIFSKIVKNDTDTKVKNLHNDVLISLATANHATLQSTVNYKSRTFGHKLGVQNIIVKKKKQKVALTCNRWAVNEGISLIERCTFRKECIKREAQPH